MKKIYISGMITGIESIAAALFDEAEKEVEAMGFIPVNPMKLEHKHGGLWVDYMREDIKALCDCDAIYMLRNCFASDGAVLELHIARSLQMEEVYQSVNMI